MKKVLESKMGAFGDRLESLRHGETQKGFAKSLGIPINTYTNWVRGIREPSMSAIINLCTQLGVSADWLLCIPNHTSQSTTIAGNSGIIATGNGARAKPPTTKLDCSTCKYKVFAEAFNAIQRPV